MKQNVNRGSAASSRKVRYLRSECFATDTSAPHTRVIFLMSKILELLSRHLKRSRNSAQITGAIRPEHLDETHQNWTILEWAQSIRKSLNRCGPCGQ